MRPMDPLLATPLSAAQGLWQMQVFFGQVLPHECEDDVNKTGNIISKYIERMRFVNFDDRNTFAAPIKMIVNA